MLQRVEHGPGEIWPIWQPPSPLPPQSSSDARRTSSACAWPGTHLWYRSTSATTHSQSFLPVVCNSAAQYEINWFRDLTVGRFAVRQPCNRHATCLCMRCRGSAQEGLLALKNCSCIREPIPPIRLRVHDESSDAPPSILCEEFWQIVPFSCGLPISLISGSENMPKGWPKTLTH